ncbi:hypothetical protein BZG36_00743 [Bifiguratus adelaidae]|uniref:Uncharacterized protein n=1 Tax=Bifiguratus adelaidae TaxID=1938954 RepID=A0A261Y729_9FUNG|nr:hypothetical protein BZG36_00743 [Bifiguratus adelaidae]
MHADRGIQRHISERTLQDGIKLAMKISTSLGAAIGILTLLSQASASPAQVERRNSDSANSLTFDSHLDTLTTQLQELLQKIYDKTYNEQEDVIGQLTDILNANSKDSPSQKGRKSKRQSDGSTPSYDTSSAYPYSGSVARPAMYPYYNYAGYPNGYYGNGYSQSQPWCPPHCQPINQATTNSAQSAANVTSTALHVLTVAAAATPSAVASPSNASVAAIPTSAAPSISSQPAAPRQAAPSNSLVRRWERRSATESPKSEQTVHEFFAPGLVPICASVDR